MVKSFNMTDQRRFQSIVVLILATAIAGLLISGCKKDNDETATTQFLKGPYLIFPDNNTQMKVLWYTNIYPGNSRIAWGKTESCSDSNIVVTEESYSSDDMHGFNYTLTGLTPGVKTYYKVIADQNTATGSFYPAPPGNATRLTFYGIGDSQPKTGMPIMFDAVSAALLNDMDRDEPNRHTLVLHGGDFVYRGRVEGDWAAGYFNNSYTNIASLFAAMPVMGAVGNHEFYNANGKIDMTHPNAFIDQYLPYPYYSDYYYSFDYGPLHVAVVDNYSTYEVGSDQYNWLSDDLTNSTKPWKIVMYHESGFGNAYDNKTVQTNLHPLLVSKNIKMVIQGHIHSYCRCLKDGIQYVTLGGGGAPLDAGRGAEGSYDPALIQKDAFVFHFGRFDLVDNKIDATIIDKDGNIIDSFSCSRTIK